MFAFMQRGHSPEESFLLAMRYNLKANTGNGENGLTDKEEAYKNICANYINDIAHYQTLGDEKTAMELINDAREFLRSEDILGLANWLKELSNEEKERMMKFGYIE